MSRRMIEAGDVTRQLALPKYERAALGRDLHAAARPELALEDPLRQRVLHLLLDGPLQRPRAVHRIEAGFAEQVARGVVERQVDVALREAAAQVAQLDVHDRAQL